MGPRTSAVGMVSHHILYIQTVDSRQSWPVNVGATGGSGAFRLTGASLFDAPANKDEAIPASALGTYKEICNGKKRSGDNLGSQH